MTLEERYEAMDKLVRRLEDAYVVETSLASRHRDRHEQWLKDQEDAIERHGRWLNAHERAMERHDEAMEALDKKLDRIADLMGFRGGNGGAK